VIGSAVFGVLGLVLCALGRWGRREADRLASVPGMPQPTHRHRAAVIRRGATTCAALGILFVALAVAVAFR
jgi:hypothetical protein